MPDRRPVALLAPLAAIAVAALVAAYAARGGPALAEHPVPIGPLHLRTAAALTEVTAPAAGGDGIPGAGLILWAVLGGTVVLLLVLVIGVLMAVRAYLHPPPGLQRRPRVAPATVEGGADLAVDQRRRLHGEILAGLDDIDAGGDPRRVIIGCWLGLERAADAAGVARSAPETPGELVSRLLAAHEVRPATLHRLSVLYREARYSVHPMGPELRDAARAALVDVHADLAGARR